MGGPSSAANGSRDGSGGGDSSGVRTSLLSPEEQRQVAAGEATTRVHILEDASRGSYWAIVRSFAVLGWTAFGGPAAHIARFHKSFVEAERWMSEGLFAELLALCQMVPGPSSTQMSFSIGILQRGVSGGLLSGILFQYPGLILMTLAGLGAAQVLVNPRPSMTAVSAGLAAVAVALVAEAAFMLGQKICRSTLTKVLCALAAAASFAYPTQWIFPALILGGGLVSLVAETNAAGQQQQQQQQQSLSADIEEEEDEMSSLGLSPLAGGLLLAFWLVLLLAAVLAKDHIPYDTAPWIHWFEAFYLTGSVAYGGGQVMLPLLQQVVVKYDTVCPSVPGNSTAAAASSLWLFASPCHQVESNSTWVTQQQFLAGLAVAQAMPGPLFNFSAYLGAIVGGLSGVAACWLGLFGPGILIIFGALPFWRHFRSWPPYRKALPGFNAAAIGLIYAAVFQLGLATYRTSPFPNASVSLAIVGYSASAFLKMSAPVAILSGGVVGALLHYIQVAMAPH